MRNDNERDRDRERRTKVSIHDLKMRNCYNMCGQQVVAESDYVFCSEDCLKDEIKRFKAFSKLFKIQDEKEEKKDNDEI